MRFKTILLVALNGMSGFYLSYKSQTSYVHNC